MGVCVHARACVLALGEGGGGEAQVAVALCFAFRSSSRKTVSSHPITAWKLLALTAHSADGLGVLWRLSLSAVGKLRSHSRASFASWLYG